MSQITFLTATKDVKKHYLYRIFTAGVPVAVWTKEVISDPNFNTVINGGPGEMHVHLARSFDDFGEDVDVKLNNNVEVWVIDKEYPDGMLLYCGYISGYSPVIDEVKEYVDVTLFSYVAEFQRIILRDTSGNTTITYNSYDPSDILRAVIGEYRRQGGTINYNTESIENTNTLVSYTFNTNTIKECIDKVIELCPVGWYWTVGADNIIYLKPKNLFADHTFRVGLEIEKLKTFRRIEALINRVLFIGGGNPALFRKYENTGSQDTYGLYEKKIVDQRVTVVATAATISNREIDQNKDPEIRSNFTIVDSNGPRSFLGYDIETIRAGQTVQVQNLNTGVRNNSLWGQAIWGVDVWGATLATIAASIVQILNVRYAPDSIDIEASSRLPQIAKRIEDINRNLEVTQTINNPAAPT